MSQVGEGGHVDVQYQGNFHASLNENNAQMPHAEICLNVQM